MILVCGEALFDVFPDGTVIAGGSPFNVARGLARSGVPTAFHGGISTDAHGEALMRILMQEGIHTQYLVRKNGPTTLVGICIDAMGQPTYSFTGQGAADKSMTRADIPDLADAITVLHFGSLSIVAGTTGDALLALARRERHRLISFDPNVRLTAAPDARLWRSRIAEFLELASIVKVSAQDIGLLWPNADPQAVASAWSIQGPKMVVLTQGAQGATAFAKDICVHVPAKNIDVVSTVGAGDAFQAALLSDLIKSGIMRADDFAGLHEAGIARLLRHCNEAAGRACIIDGGLT